MLRHLACLFLSLSISGPALAARLNGQVLRVIDGDSLMFQAEGAGAPLEVRLKDIDAPEGCQAGGDEARDFLQSRVRDKSAQLDTLGRDGYGRTLAVLRVDGVDINQRLVAEGHAWALRSKWDRGTYVAQEKMAKSLKRGLHAERGAVLPSAFRRTHGRCDGTAPDKLSAATPAVDPAAASPARPAPAPAPRGGLPAFRCDGRTHCSQMSSCAEATWFLTHCPGVKMDGNGDGVPCERQWCTR